jgi:hypothetical protein
MILERRPLAANEPYTQPGRDRFEGSEPIGSVRGLVYASHAGTLYLEESDDNGENWSQTVTLAVDAATTTPLPWTTLTKAMYRFRYVNGATKQTKFRLVQQTRGMSLDDVAVTSSALPTGAATQTTLVAVLAALGGTITTELLGSTLQEQLTQADAVANVLTFSANITAIEIYHEESTWQTFIVNGLTFKIPAGGYRTPIGGVPGTTATIPAGINCLIGRLT